MSPGRLAPFKERSRSFCIGGVHRHTASPWRARPSWRKRVRVGCGCLGYLAACTNAEPAPLSAKHAGPIRQPSLLAAITDSGRHDLKRPWLVLPRLRRFGEPDGSTRDSRRTFSPEHPHWIPGGAVCAPTFLNSERNVRPVSKPACGGPPWARCGPAADHRTEVL